MNCTEQTKPQFKVLKTIKRGAGFNTPDDFRHALQDSGRMVSECVKNMMSQPVFISSLVGDPEQEYDLVLLTTQQLTGKKQNATTIEVFAGAARLGLEKCLAWMGPKLRLGYSDQPNGEWIRVGMKSIPDSYGHPHLFSVGCSASELWLNDIWRSPDDVWPPGALWVFVLPRK